MQKILTTLLLDLDGKPIRPPRREDVLPLAKEATLGALALVVGKDATLQALLSALQALPWASTRINRVAINLANALNNAVVPLGALTHVHAITVADLTGTIQPTLKVNGTGETPIPLVKGEVRDQLDATALHVSCAAGGGNLVLELHGR